MSRTTEYRKKKRLNYSTLKLIWDDPFLVKWKLDNPEAEDEETAAFRIGGAIDCLMTTPEQFQEEYWVSSDTRPWGRMGTFIDNLSLDIDENSTLPEYQEAYEKAGYKLKLETVVAQLWANEKYKQFFLARKAALGKSVLAEDEFNICVVAKDALLFNETTKSYFVNKDPNVLIYHQVPIYFTYKGVECKGMLDGLIIDKNKSTVQFFDLKSVGRKVNNFENSFLFYKYYLQAALYQEAVKELIAGRASSPVSIDPYISNCKLLNPDYVAVHKNAKFSTVRVFEITSDTLSAGVFGGISNRGEYFPGISDLMDAYKWHCETNQWRLPQRVHENNGKEPLDCFRLTFDPSMDIPE